MNQIQLKHYQDLLTVVKTPFPKQSVIGVIQDATGTYKTDDSYDYVCKIKIIDHTYNNMQKTSKEILPYVHIFVFSSEIQQSPRVSQIGDILVLQDFFFDTYQDELVRGTFKKYSKWAILDGFSQEIIFKQNLHNISLNKYEKEYVFKLQKFSSEFFQQYSLKQLSWFQIKDFSEHFNKQQAICEFKDVDLIAKVVDYASSIVNNDGYSKIVFIDDQMREYFSEIRNLRVKLEKNQFVKLRSVSIQAVNNTYSIDFFNYSEILIIPPNFKDAIKLAQKTKNFVSTRKDLQREIKNEQHLEKYQKEQINQYTVIYKQAKAVIELKKLEEFENNFPILSNFDLSKPYSMKSIVDQFGSLVLKKQIQETTNLKDLKEILDQADRSPVNQYRDECYRIKVNIKDAEFKTLEDTLKFIQNANSLEKDIEIYDHKQLKKLKNISSMNTSVFIQNKFYITDSTYQENFEIFLHTIDSNPEYIFDLWQIIPNLKVEEFLNQQNWNQTKTNFDHSFSQLLKSNKIFDFAIQLAYNKQKKRHYLKIVDTIFWFVNN